MMHLQQHYGMHDASTTPLLYAWCIYNTPIDGMHDATIDTDIVSLKMQDVLEIKDITEIVAGLL